MLDVFIYYEKPCSENDSPRKDDIGNRIETFLFRSNEKMIELFPQEKEITKEYLITLIQTISANLKSDNLDDIEVILFCTYLLHEEKTPCWIEYSL